MLTRDNNFAKEHNGISPDRTQKTVGFLEHIFIEFSGKIIEARIACRALANCGGAQHGNLSLGSGLAGVALEFSFEVLAFRGRSSGGGSGFRCYRIELFGSCDS